VIKTRPFGENTFPQASVLFTEQLLQENSFCESRAAASKRSQLENTFFNATSFSERTLSPLKGVLFVEPLRRENNFSDTRATVSGNTLFQNSFSFCFRTASLKNCVTRGVSIKPPCELEISIKQTTDNRDHAPKHMGIFGSEFN